MEFLKNLFTNDNSVIGLACFKDEKDINTCLDFIFTDYCCDPPINLAYRNREHLKNIFSHWCLIFLNKI